MTHSKKHRSRTEIIYDILQTVRSEGIGAGKTKIMYNSFLSYYQVKEYLTILLDNGLLQYNSGIQKFRITQKGLKFLELCDQIDGFKEEQHPQTVLKKNNIRKFYNCRSDRRIALMVVKVLFSIQFED